MRCNYDAILLDFDGTLCDSWELVKETYVETLAHFDPYSTYEHIDDIRTCHDYMESFRLLFKRKDVGEEILSYSNELYASKLSRKPSMFSGAEELITTLNEQGVFWAVVTGKKRRFAEKIISNIEYFNGYSMLVCADDVKKGKPSPEGLKLVCNKLKINPNSAVYVGDLLTDILAAQSCNMPAIWASYGYEKHEVLKKTTGYMVINKPLELLELIFSN